MPTDLLDAQTQKLLQQVQGSAFRGDRDDRQPKSLDQMLQETELPIGTKQVSSDDPLNPHLVTFHYIPDARSALFTNSGLRGKLSKWGFSESMLFARFRYEENLPVHTEQGLQKLVNAFFHSPAGPHTQVLNGLGLTPLTVSDAEKLESYTKTFSNGEQCLDIVEYNQISTKETSMGLLERLEDKEIGAIGANGHIKGRLDEFIGDITVNNVIREVLFMEESDLYDTYSDAERKEFLFRIFQHLILGGAVNQYDDNIDGYLKATKAVYRDLLSAKKRETDGEVEISSIVLEIKNLKKPIKSDANEKENKTDEEILKAAERNRALRMVGKAHEAGGLYSKKNDSNFCYMIVDQLMRHVTLWRHQYDGQWH